jgi:hypothetical protein
MVVSRACENLPNLLRPFRTLDGDFTLGIVVQMVGMRNRQATSCLCSPAMNGR